jgi:hypothetical protein
MLLFVNKLPDKIIPILTPFREGLLKMENIWPEA